MAGAPSYQAFTGPDGFACDFLPYRRSNAYFRTFAATTPEDWTNNAALKNKADDTIRFVEIAASSRATSAIVSASSTASLASAIRSCAATT